MAQEANVISEIKGKSILITGGTGSFGNAFVSELLKFGDDGPSKIIVFSRDELKQYEMKKKFSGKRMRYFIGDIRDSERLTLAMNGVDIVIHAAALKQVPSAELNPMECIKTNVHGAQNVIVASLSQKVSKVVALSTDKACNPVNLYGATKLASDKLFIAANTLVGSARKPLYSVVRYGNVAGSRGSVLPFFLDLIRDGKSHLPVTDPEMTRFWITIEQGVRFILSCLTFLKGGELFIPKMPSFRVADVVKSIGSDFTYEVIGRRAGEKIHESLFSQDESYLVTEFDSFFVMENHMLKSSAYVAPSEFGKPRPVGAGFCYNSASNTWVLEHDALNEAIKQFRT